MAPLPEVLIVDDDAVIRNMLKDALADVPCVVREAASGDTALSELEKSPPAVVLLDLVMPGRSGMDLLVGIIAKALPTQVVVVSSLDTESVVQQALKLGAFGYVAKPFHPLDVQSVVRAALEKGAHP